MNTIANIRNRFSKKSAAALLVFTLALTGTGLGTLASLTDTASKTITASITSIDLQVDGSKAAAVDFGQVLPGSDHWVPVVITNSGSGYFRLNASSISNGSPVTLDSRVNINVGIPAAFCNSTDAPYMDNQNAVPVVQSSLFAERIVGADGTTGPNGDTLELCLVYRVGTTTGSGYGQVGFSTTLNFIAEHP